MVRELVRGKSKEVVRDKVNFRKHDGWYPVSEIKQDPSSYDLEYVCVIQRDAKHNSNTKWGSKFHLE